MVTDCFIIKRNLVDSFEQRILPMIFLVIYGTWNLYYKVFHDIVIYEALDWKFDWKSSFLISGCALTLTYVGSWLTIEWRNYSMIFWLNFFKSLKDKQNNTNTVTRADDTNFDDDGFNDKQTKDFSQKF